MILSTRVDFSSELDYWIPDVERGYTLYSSPWIVWPGIKAFQRTSPTAIIRSKQAKAKGVRTRDGSSGTKDRKSSAYFGQGDLVEI